MVIQSGDKVALPDEDLKRVLELLDDGMCIKMSGYGHSLGIEKWNVSDLMKAIISFLKSLR